MQRKTQQEASLMAELTLCIKIFPQVIKTLKNKPDDEFTKPNLIQWEKKQKVPLIDGNDCSMIMCKVKFEMEMILNKMEYSVRTGEWLTKYN